MANNLSLKIKYLAEVTPIQKSENGDWLDLRVSEDISMHKGEIKYLPLGVAMKLPRGYEALVIPRSSTCKKHKIIQSNSIGLIDESYCGDDDQWYFPAYAIEDTFIPKDTRICQFRIVRHSADFTIKEVDQLGAPNRGGLGSTGEM